MGRKYLLVCDSLAAVVRLAVRTLMVVMTVDVLVGVFFRYVVGDALSWTEELARYCMVWMGFLGMGLALREGSHVAVDFLAQRLPAPTRRAVMHLVSALSFIFLAVVTGFGVMLVVRVANQRAAVLGISMAWPYLAIPIGCLFTAAELVAMTIRGVSAGNSIGERTC